MDFVDYFTLSIVMSDIPKSKSVIDETSAKVIRSRGRDNNPLDKLVTSNQPPMTEEENAAAAANVQSFESATHMFYRSQAEGKRVDWDKVNWDSALIHHTTFSDAQ